MKKSLILGMAMAVGLLMPSCEDIVEQVPEVDPTAPVDAPAALILSGAQVSYFGLLEGEMARLAGMWAGYFTGSDRQYIALENYNVVAGDFNGGWGDIYAGVVQQTNIIQAKTAETNNLMMMGVSQVMEAHVVGLAASLWGDVPFEEAGNFEEFPNPAYEPQAQVYAKVQALLDVAIENLASGVGLIEGDILYEGNAALWIQAAHTLKARFYMHTGNYELALANALLGITEPSEEMIVEHGTSYGNDINIFASFLWIDRFGYLTAEDAFLAKALDPAQTAFGPNRNTEETDESARFDFFFDGTAEADYDPSFRGMFYYDAPFELISYEENMLIIAEAALRTNQPDLALEALNEYRAALNDEFGEGLYEELEAEDFASNEELLQEILFEEYITLYGDIEVFNLIRRTDNAIGVPLARGEVFPQRFLYPQSEINSNTSTPSPLPGLFDPVDVFQP